MTPQPKEFIQSNHFPRSKLLATPLKEAYSRCLFSMIKMDQIFEFNVHNLNK